MLTIRLSRHGRRKNAFYRLIISEKHKDTQSNYLEQLGHYNPHTKKAVFSLERIAYWLTKGAQMSNTVHNLFVKEGVIKADKKRKAVSISDRRRKVLDEAKAKAEVRSEVVAEKPAEAAAEVPAETPTESAPAS